MCTLLNRSGLWVYASELRRLLSTWIDSSMQVPSSWELHLGEARAQTHRDQGVQSRPPRTCPTRWWVPWYVSLFPSSMHNLMSLLSHGNLQLEEALGTNQSRVFHTVLCTHLSIPEQMDRRRGRSRAGEGQLVSSPSSHQSTPRLYVAHRIAD